MAPDRPPLARWVEQGKIKAIVDIVDGLDKAPQALIGLFEGRNKEKMAVRVWSTLYSLYGSTASKTVVGCL